MSKTPHAFALHAGKGSHMHALPVSPTSSPTTSPVLLLLTCVRPDARLSSWWW